MSIGQISSESGYKIILFIDTSYLKIRLAVAGEIIEISHTKSFKLEVESLLASYRFSGIKKGALLNWGIKRRFCPHPQPLSQSWERGARAAGSGGVRANHTLNQQRQKGYLDRGTLSV
ncbi:hypothetical protein [Chamaesiphon polymorphus]|uniref:Uncharacterized protein n=1 Tax=Chamaesiphon polymorphus CCALA 037 TaxID=2107692 RepID=A0A2T1G2L4_9CYAN|nr:hypothetical protein [Chamaesiphon polymorphus]PSB51482.1 hypothetical protein C7B77_21570 [Chamaesiphon polymorphus CCALA 037]